LNLWRMKNVVAKTIVCIFSALWNGLYTWDMGFWCVREGVAWLYKFLFVLSCHWLGVC
jgi:hypothetical protein